MRAKGPRAHSAFRARLTGRAGHSICLALLLSVLMAATLHSTAAAADPPNAWWRLSAPAAPTNMPAGSEGLVNVVADNFGNVGLTGVSEEITITDVLPVGLRVTDPDAVNPHRARIGNRSAAEKEKFWSCDVTEERIVSCSTDTQFIGSSAIPPFEPLILEIPVQVDLPAHTSTTLINKVSVSGGQLLGTLAPMPAQTLQRPIKISDAPVAFGLEEDGYQILAENADGSTDTQAGSHPYQLTSSLQFNRTITEVQEQGSEEGVQLAPGAPALAKNLSFELPPGLLGNVTAAARCSEVDFAALKEETNRCPAQTAVGVATVTLLEPNRLRYVTIAVPVFNLEPGYGEPARFGFEAKWVPVVLDASVRTDGDYGVSVKVNNATEAAQVLGAQVSFWGDPSSESHDASRGWGCLREGIERNLGETCDPPNPRANTAFLTLPTSCDSNLITQMAGNSWTGQTLSGQYEFKDALGNPLGGLTGCGALPFEPSIDVSPVQPGDQNHPEEHTSAASTPTGLDVSVKLPQQTTLSPDALAQSAVRSTTVTLPQGMMLNPSAANGLAACSESQIGYIGKGLTDPFAPGSVQPLRFSSDPPSCPNASKVGTVRVKTPLLAEELSGSVYLAAQDQNPFGSLIALYIVAENQQLGLRVKLAGQGQLDPSTGQIQTTFSDTPQVPFEELQVKLFGGPRGSVSTPALCGSYAASASITPWSGSAPVNISSDPASFSISSGPAGGPCADPLPFAPALSAGVENLQGGAFSPFSLHIGHPDSDQALTGVSVHLPPGAAAMLSAVTPCPEPQASLGTCGPDSLIGHASATSGLGPEPFTVNGGRVYITGPYGGGPFGVSIVTPAVAGPFDLGNVVVRSSIKVDPFTAAVTISSALPTIVQGVGKAPSGVPLALKAVDVTIDRPNFEFNPTNCDPMAITTTLTGAQGASANVSSPFQLANCQSLAFHPILTASTKGNSSKANGANFTVRVTSTPGQANIAKVKLVLPIALPARLTTIQKACTDKVFDQNPAACPEGSNIGTAIAHTPVLKSPLTGPAYLVSHGSAAFPDVEFVLQGEGITLILDGQTDIKKGITTSTFNSVPDAPVSSFETVLPQGPHSALTANVPQAKRFSLCGQKLMAPTTITAQNGAVITQQTKIPVLGCKAVKPFKATRAQKLAKALKGCRRQFKHRASKRKGCEGKARKRFGARKAAQPRDLTAGRRAMPPISGTRKPIA